MDGVRAATTHRERRDQANNTTARSRWIPAFAGMTVLGEDGLRRVTLFSLLLLTLLLLSLLLLLWLCS